METVDNFFFHLEKDVHVVLFFFKMYLKFFSYILDAGKLAKEKGDYRGYGPCCGEFMRFDMLMFEVYFFFSLSLSLPPPKKNNLKLIYLVYI